MKPGTGQSRWSTAAGLGCLMLFALPFAATGAGVGGWVLYELWTWQSAQRWIETSAELLKVDLDTDIDSEGSETYSATARYAYEFNGRRYENDRVSLHTGRDNFGSYQRDRARELREIAEHGGKTVCYVNPDDPRQAMLFRGLRPGLVAFKMAFAAIFGAVGFGLLIGSVIGYRRQGREERVKANKPGKPWLWREDWAAGRIRSSDGTLAWVLTPFAVVWNVVSWPAFILVLSGAAQHQQSGAPILLVAAFPAVGTGVALWAGYLWLRRLRWGVSEFELAAVPGVIGGPLAGVIHAPAGIVPVDGFTLRLVCNETRRESSGGESRMETKALWDSQKSIHRGLATSDGTRTLIPVKFLVPYGLPPSGDDLSWQLEVKAETVGIDYFASFEVPVFQTAASSASVTEESAVEADADAATPDLHTTVSRMNGVLEEELPDRRVIYFPMGRNRGMAAFLALFVVVWTAVCYGLFASDAPRIFPLVCLLFEALLVYALIGACFTSSRLTYSPRGIEIAERRLGRGRMRDLVRTSITSVSVDKSGTTWGNTSYRKIVAETDDGEQTLVSEIAGSPDAERLAADIRSVLGLAEQGDAMPLEAALPKEFARKD